MELSALDTCIQRCNFLERFILGMYETQSRDMAPFLIFYHFWEFHSVFQILHWYSLEELLLTILYQLFFVAIPKSFSIEVISKQDSMRCILKIGTSLERKWEAVRYTQVYSSPLAIPLSPFNGGIFQFFSRVCCFPISEKKQMVFWVQLCFIWL